MYRKIKLYGKLADFIGHKELNVNKNIVKTPANAIRFLISNFKGLENHIRQNSYLIKVNDNNIYEEEMILSLGNSDIHIVPAIQGSGGAGRVLGGIALIGLAFATGGASLSLSTGLTFKAGALGGVFVSKALVYGGGLLALSGAAQMLAPQPQTPDFQSTEDPRISFNFSGIQNVTRAGTPIPLVYGEIFTGSVIISAAVDTQQVQA